MSDTVSRAPQQALLLTEMPLHTVNQYILRHCLMCLESSLVAHISRILVSLAHQIFEHDIVTTTTNFYAKDMISMFDLAMDIRYSLAAQPNSKASAEPSRIMPRPKMLRSLRVYFGEGALPEHFL